MPSILRSSDSCRRSKWQRLLWAHKALPTSPHCIRDLPHTFVLFAAPAKHRILCVCGVYSIIHIPCIMFLGWISREGLLVPETGADPLAVYSPAARKAVCRAIVSDVAASPARLLAATATEPQLAWCLACLGHALTLPLAPSQGELTAATAAAGSSNIAKETAHQVRITMISYHPLLSPPIFYTFRLFLLTPWPNEWVLVLTSYLLGLTE